MSDKDLESEMREKAIEIWKAEYTEKGLLVDHITAALLSVARERDAELCPYCNGNGPFTILHVERCFWQPKVRKLEAELAQARAELARLHTGIGLFVDAHTELQDDYKECLEAGDRIMTELEQARGRLIELEPATINATLRPDLFSLVDQVGVENEKLRADLERAQAKIKSIREAFGLMIIQQDHDVDSFETFFRVKPDNYDRLRSAIYEALAKKE